MTHTQMGNGCFCGLAFSNHDEVYSSLFYPLVCYVLATRLCSI